jgi:hypothetical protein
VYNTFNQLYVNSEALSHILVSLTYQLQNRDSMTINLRCQTMVILAVIAGAGAYTATAQEINPNYSLPGMDVFSSPNAPSKRAYGDGDVNSDGNIDFVDAQAIYRGANIADKFK